MSRPGDHGYRHVIIMNRWKDCYADYASYLDHERVKVTYITSRAGLGSVPAAATETVTLADIEDLDALRAAVAGLAERHGRPDLLITLKEEDLANAAVIRAEWGLPGQTTEEVRTFRDKAVMVGRIQAAGLPAPAFRTVADAAEVVEFAAEHGWELIVKPRSGSASVGVVRVDAPQDLAAIDFTRGNLMVQVRNPHPVHHIDGVFDGEKLAVWRGSRYLNTCFDFNQGTFLGSVERDDPLLHQVIGDCTEQFMRALTDKPIPFHLELFLEEGPNGPTCSFLEVGGRVGGSETPFLWREVHGYDLMEAAFRIQLGLPLPEPVDWSHEDCAGWLLLPAPSGRVTDVVSMTGRTPGPYTERLLAVGDVLPATAGYEHVGARFRFRAGTSAEVHEAIMATYRDFRITAEPVETCEPVEN
ncbi:MULTISPECIES: ATP-grasp domain-containing protein [Streptomyces]|uniref:ATP-grasp domain-containing protein n=1 Tax=Streptomyces TaxID=1883 RepID=UPI0004C011EF|nr:MULTISPECIES: hypothetical protein [Streptomyces]